MCLQTHLYLFRGGLAQGHFRQLIQSEPANLSSFEIFRKGSSQQATFYEKGVNMKYTFTRIMFALVNYR